jgi:hypothetical protein
VSDKVMKMLLYAENVIVPFETINGTCEVSSLIIMKSSDYQLFNFIEEDDGPMGPIDLIESDNSSDQIKRFIAASGDDYVSGVVENINFTRSSTIFHDRFENVIEAIDLFMTDGRILQMRRSGAGYPYSLALNIINVENYLKIYTER